MPPKSKSGRPIKVPEKLKSVVLDMSGGGQNSNKDSVNDSGDVSLDERGVPTTSKSQYQR